MNAVPLKPERGSCPLCKQMVHGVLLDDATWLPLKTSEHVPSCPMASEPSGFTALDLVFADWVGMPAHEREQALSDLRELAQTHAADQRRARALNVMASFFHFLTEKIVSR